jgi:predicted MPP superfamily phosphohydrolase
MNKLLRFLSLSGLACLLYGVLVEPRSFQVRREGVPVLPEGANEIRLLHISDAHLSRHDRHRIAFMESLAALEPDMVVCTGDMVSEPEAIPLVAAALGRLLQAPGVFVFGSSDYERASFRNPLKYLFSPSRRLRLGLKPTIPTAELAEALAASGWTDLTDRRAVKSLRGTNVEFRGTGDAHISLDDYPAVAGPPQPGTDLIIGVTHSPYQKVLNEMTADNASLILTGHTHGGQVCVPIYGALTTNCDLDRHRAKGLSKWTAVANTALGSGAANANASSSDATGSGSANAHATTADPTDAPTNTAWLHVSAGFGASPYTPFRFACPPEVTLLTLKPAPTRRPTPDN